MSLFLLFWGKYSTSWIWNDFSRFRLCHACSRKTNNNALWHYLNDSPYNRNRTKKAHILIHLLYFPGTRNYLHIQVSRIFPPSSRLNTITKKQYRQFHDYIKGERSLSRKQILPPSHPRYCLSNYTSEAMSHNEDSRGERCRHKHLNMLHKSVAKFIVPDSGIKGTVAWDGF